VAKAPPKQKKAAKSAEAPVTPPPAVALRRGRHPVNPESDFALFRSAHRIGSRLEGEVTAFTSHGAVIKVALKNGQLIECYAPTTSLGDPAPARARDVLKRGDRRTFRLVAVDAERRIAELALL
jgi:ribosomal protein S1